MYVVCGNTFSKKGMEQRSLERAEEERQAGTQGQWQLESPDKEYLEQVKRGDDTCCTERMMKKGFTALKSGDWEEYKGMFREEAKATEWTSDRVKEAFEQVAQDDAEKLSIVQETMIRSTDYLRRISASVGGQGGVTMSYLCLHCNSFPCKTTSGGLWEKRAQQLVVRNCTEIYDWKQPNMLLVVQTGESVDQAKVFKAHAVPQGLCANLINALELLANQQEDGDGLLQNIVINLGGESRKGLTDGLRESIKIDNKRH